MSSLSVQIPGSTEIASGDIRVLTVDEDCVRMSDFIKKKLRVAEFTNGHAFYEFKRSEDLDFYKEIILASGESPVDEHEV